jgi:hypothetical protein
MKGVMSEFKNAKELIKYLKHNKVSPYIFHLYFTNLYPTPKKGFKIKELDKNFKYVKYDAGLSDNDEKILKSAIKNLDSLGFSIKDTKQYDGKSYYIILFNDKISVGLETYYSSWDGPNEKDFSDWFEVTKKEVTVVKFYKKGGKELKPE